VSSPEQVPEPSDALRDDLSAQFGLQAQEHDVVVSLDPAWVPLLSEGMLGEALEADAEGAADLMQEIASQGFGTVQSTLASEGLELSTLQFEAFGPGEAPSSPDGPFWHVSFSTQHEGTELSGFALLPASEAESDRADAPPQQEESSQEQRTPEDAASAQQERSEEASEVEVSPAAFSDLGKENIGGDGGSDEAISNFELLAEVDLEVRVELGRRELPLADVLKLTDGSVIELEKMVGEPLSVYANGRLIAEGEAVVIDEQFGVRITNLASEGRREKAFF